VTTLQQARADARELNLTSAWTPLKPHEQQALFFWHPARFKLNPSGRRSGKTELAIRKGILYLTRRLRHGFPARVGFAAPTRQQAKDIFWDKLKAMIPESWIAKISETELKITTHWGASIRVVGFDEPKRIEGQPWDHFVCDELADCKPRSFALHLRPALSTLGREGTADLIGVPDETGRNQLEYERLWAIGLQWRPGLPPVDPKKFDDDEYRGPDAEVCSFHWPSSEILDPREIASARGQMDPLEFEQEYGGKFVRSGGKALPFFNEAVHVVGDTGALPLTAYCPQIRIDLALDFGFRNGAGLIGQTYQNHVWIMDEIAVPGSGTDSLMIAFGEKAAQRGWNLRRLGIYGDAAGEGHSSPRAETDFEIVEEFLPQFGVQEPAWEYLTANPLVKNTVNVVRRRLLSADNRVMLHVHPRCARLIGDMKNAPWPDDLRSFHWLAALRYYLWRLFGESEYYESAPTGLPQGRKAS
jgi:hypothetical protein